MLLLFFCYQIDLKFSFHNLFIFIFLDILRTDIELSVDETDSSRRQKACDTESLSQYNKLAKTGGHKGKNLQLLTCLSTKKLLSPTFTTILGMHIKAIKKNLKLEFNISLLDKRKIIEQFQL